MSHVPPKETHSKTTSYAGTRWDNVFDTPVSVFRNIFDKVGEAASLRDFLFTFTPEMEDLAERIRSTKDKDELRRLKRELPCAMLGGTYDSILRHSGLVAIEINETDNPGIDLESLKKEMRHVPCVAYAGAKAEGGGILAIVRIKSPSLYKQHLAALKRDFAHFGLKIETGNGHPFRLTYCTIDCEPFTNEHACPYTKIDIKTEDRKPTIDDILGEPDFSTVFNGWMQSRPRTTSGGTTAHRSR